MLDKSAQAKFTDKGGKICWSQTCIQNKNDPEQDAGRQVCQCPGCGTTGLPVPTGAWYLCCRNEIPPKSRWGSAPHKICDLIPPVHFLLPPPPPISWGMVAPGHLPGSNGPSLQSSSPWISLPELRQSLYLISTNFMSLCRHHMAWQSLCPAGRVKHTTKRAQVTLKRKNRWYLISFSEKPYMHAVGCCYKAAERRCHRGISAISLMQCS